VSLSVLAVLAAEDSDRVATMIRLFFVALIIVSPFGIWKFVTIKRSNRVVGAPESTPDDDTSTDLIADPTDLTAALARIEDLLTSEQAVPTTPLEVVVPAAPTIDGRPVGAEVADRIVHDALARRGYRTSSAVDDGENRVLSVSRQA